MTHGYTDASGKLHTYINQEQYSILVTVVIASAIVPTLIAEKWFKPDIEPVIALEVAPSSSMGPTPGADGAPADESRPTSIRGK